MVAEQKKEKQEKKKDTQQEVVGVIFYEGCSIYHFDPGTIDCRAGDLVIVETSKGEELGRVKFRRSEPGEKLDTDLKPVTRFASKEDIRSRKEFSAREKDAFQRCKDKITKHNLPMRLTGAHYNYNGKRLTFFFTAEGRVDFRELVKDLASTFNTRIDLKQIGPKDEARLTGGMGICGLGLCCREFLLRPPPTSTRMAKNQELSSKRPEKISGLCGRLMCCLNYEDDFYVEAKKKFPQKRTKVKLPGGEEGRIIDLRVLKGKVVVEIGDEIKKRVEISVDEVKVLS